MLKRINFSIPNLFLLFLSCKLPVDISRFDEQIDRQRYIDEQTDRQRYIDVLTNRHN